jgi:hypothetical protein
MRHPFADQWETASLRSSVFVTNASRPGLTASHP